MPRFQQRHYIAIAHLFALATRTPERDAIIERFADYFKADNAFFSHDKFIRACDLDYNDGYWNESF